MKLRSAIIIATVISLEAVGAISISPQLTSPIHAAENKDATGLTNQQKIDLITKNKGVFGNGDQLRRFFFGDLRPLAVQQGGTGTIVTLYNKANDVTFAYCSDFDVVIAVRKGKISTFPAAEVKI
jgi:hypothetical protein